MIPCMGGFCQRRDSCPNYHVRSSEEPAERLCGSVDGQRKAAVRDEPEIPIQPQEGRSTNVRESILCVMTGKDWQTYHEIATAASLPVGTVRKALARLCSEEVAERIIKDHGIVHGQASTLFRLCELG
jgi:hypothetical protein